MDQDRDYLSVTVDLQNDSTGSLLEAVNTTLSFERVLRVVVPAIFGLIAVVGFAGNLLVIVVVVVNAQMRSTTNLLIICLATADLLFIVVCVPFTAIAYSIPVWPFGLIWCRIHQYVIHVTAYVSVYTLVLMSFDRYLAVVHPISSMTLRTRSKTTTLIFAFYVTIVTLNAFTFDDFKVVGYVYFREPRSACLHIRSVTDRAYGRRFYACFFAFGYLVPLGLITLLYGLMIRKLLRRAPRPGGSGSRSSSTKARSNRRVTLMVVVVVVVFAICWCPIQVMLVLQAFEAPPGNGMAFLSVKIVSNCLAYLNSCVNPILYAFLSESFRKGFRNVLGCRDRRPEAVGLMSPPAVKAPSSSRTNDFCLLKSTVTQDNTSLHVEAVTV